MTPKTTKVVWFSGLNCVIRETRMPTDSDFMAYVRARGSAPCFMAQCPRTGERAWYEAATDTWHAGTPEDAVRSEGVRACERAKREGVDRPWDRVIPLVAAEKDSMVRKWVLRLEKGESLQAVAHRIAVPPRRIVGGFPL